MAAIGMVGGYGLSSGASTGTTAATASSSTGMSLGTGLMLGGIALQGVQSYFGNKTLSIQSKTREKQAALNAKLARLNAKNKALGMTEDFNKQMASNAVVAAAQNRRGATVQGMASAAESELEWDIAYAEFDGEMEYSNNKISQEGYKSQVSSYKDAGNMAAGMSLLNAGAYYAKDQQDQKTLGKKEA